MALDYTEGNILLNQFEPIIEDVEDSIFLADISCRAHLQIPIF